MKGSEALLRAIASAGGEIPATQLDVWMGKLVDSKFVSKEVRDDGEVFYYSLTEKSKLFLRKKGVKV